MRFTRCHHDTRVRFDFWGILTHCILLGMSDLSNFCSWKVSPLPSVTTRDPKKNPPNMPTQTRFLYSILATLIFLLFTTLGIIYTSAGSLASLSQKFHIHVCPKESRSTPPIIRKFQSLTPLLGAKSDGSLPHDTNRSWESLLLPENGGILKVRTHNNTITDYGISMFHQLHCLTVLRGLIFPETSQHHGASTSPSHSGDEHEDAVHWAHCFDYIAQVS